MISTAHTTTLLLREKYCATWFLGCWQYDFRPRAIFDDAAFWESLRRTAGDTRLVPVRRSGTA
jgi:hypothetical protein